MKYFILLLMIFTLISPLLPITWEIKQDGTGNFTTIGTGITAAQDGDTLLVYPGIYYERINYQGKNITITSLFNGDEYDATYIANTVIDGNHEGTVVTFNSGETRDAVLNGFTIRHGNGEFHDSQGYTSGGGIYMRNSSSPTISNCHIKNNHAFDGSAICLYIDGNPLLKGNTISYNYSIRYGAVVSAGGPNDLEFCQESLNSIYLNFGGRACDLFLGGHNQTPVIVDTFTVVNPDRYFLGISRNIPDNFTFTVLHNKLEPVAADLYVHPDGCDSNSGLSPAAPLQTIAMAMTKIAPDSLQQRTIYIADGIYSRSLNNQHFPIQMRPYIDVIGNSKETTILDMEHETLAFMSANVIVSNELLYNLGSFTIRNFAITNGGNPLMDSTRGAFHFYYTNMPIIIENIDVHNGYIIGGHNAQAVIYHGGESILRNLHFYDNMGGSALDTGGHWGPFLNLYGENIRIRNNSPGPLLPNYEGGYGGGLSMTAGSFIPEPINVTLVNLEITDCERGNIDPPWVGGPWGNLSISGREGLVRIINATIGNNFTSSYYGGGITIRRENTVELINSIIYGNTPHQIVLDNTESLAQNIIISHSLIQCGQEGIVYYQNSNSVVHWGEGNINADPLWLGEVDPDYTGEYPYTISEFSPARNAGTLNIPNFEFPEFDLAGNPRIYGDYIDMGAYEWNPNVGVENEDDLFQIASPHNYNLYNYPNPVVNLQGMGRGKGVGTTISFVMPRGGKVVIDIYNIKGQFIKRVIEAHYPAGEYQVLWNGRDEQERVVATGFYVYRLEIDGTTVATGRCTFIK